MNRLLVGLTLTGILSGAAAWALGFAITSDMLWAATTAVMRLLFGNSSPEF